jgi:GNAT superfamily N-acetyltransferase
LVDENYQGKGIGSRLIQTALDFCRTNNYKRVFLWIFKGLDKGSFIYEKVGFVLDEEKSNHEWSNVEIIEQKMTLEM